MSTIISANVSDGTLSIPTTFVTNGSAKAWVNFNGTGTIAIRDSFNVASLTDRGAGEYTVTVSSAFATTSYVALGNPLPLNPPSVFLNQPWVWQENGNVARTVSAVAVWTNQSATTFDTDLACVHMTGDLA
jgi:hypothetical protein